MPLFVEIAVPTSITAIEIAAESLTGISLWEIQEARRQGRPFPTLYESGVVYRREHPGTIRHPEDWQTAQTLFASKEGDCEDVANVRAAELRDEGDDGAYVAIIKNPSGSYHAIVERGDGSREDPSRILIALEDERRKQPPMAKPIVRTRDLGSYCLGEVVMPLTGGGSVRARGVGAFPWDGLRKAAAVAARIANDPAIAPFLPPGSQIAIKEALAISKLAQNNPALLKRVAPGMEPAGKAIATSFLRHRDRKGMTTQQAPGSRKRDNRGDDDDDDDDDDDRGAQPQPQRMTQQERYQRALDRYAASNTPEAQADLMRETEAAFSEAAGEDATGDAEGDDYFAAYEDQFEAGEDDDLTGQGPR